MKLKDFLNFLVDKRLLLAVGIFLFFELLFQLGIYRTYLKKNSYAANINRVTDHILKSRKILDPTILIVGTSVAFEGISVRILNEELASTNEKVQSIAVRGSEIIVQHQLLEKHLSSFPNVHTIIHVLEPGMAWVDRPHLVEPTLVMMSEVGNFRAMELAREFGYNITFTDYLFLASKSIAYRKDLADMVINFNERIKAIARRNKNPNRNPWDYENPNIESMGPYHIDSVEECLKITGPDSTMPIPLGSNPDHRRMIYETCGIAKSVPQESFETENTRRYFGRLRKMYSMIGDRKIHIIDVFAPYSSAIRKLNSTERMEIWKQGLTNALDPHQSLDQLDFQTSLGITDNGEYCFDLIHLNRKGMETFSKIFGMELKRRFGKK
ncbi:hypothetical protein EHQ58_04410 [Leptospira ognonensis]|uniref:SGNH/GDSL hydrolase family protein n=1 Tax=Leptospira ognonensis TaxID=2484945 RepID=A0A4R9K872_9LEPT|nr:hypothetical protein [Leptospira ognonensis]TGL61862.1 hypothetical protein EHQ58_04410 [Leptospira ognonensis]